MRSAYHEASTRHRVMCLKGKKQEEEEDTGMDEDKEIERRRTMLGEERGGTSEKDREKTIG